jgi:hypothetical protein
VVEATFHEGIECLFAGVSAGSVSTVMTKGDGLGEGHVESERPSDAGRDLGDLQRVGETGAHVVVGKNEDLSFAGQASKRAGMQDAIAIALKARAKLIGLFLALARAASKTARGAWHHEGIKLLLAGRQGTGQQGASGLWLADGGC